MKFAATFHDIEGQSVFISGGGSGIGEYLTEGFVAQGAKVAFVQRSDATSVPSMTVEQEDTEDLKSMIYDFGLML
jgi:NAD(P)-dependent dehydrogenase (short-subunit alcohol dehydrogenase family)